MAFTPPKAFFTNIIPRSALGTGNIPVIGEIAEGYTFCTLDRIAEKPELLLLPAGAYELRPYAEIGSAITSGIAKTLGLKQPAPTDRCSYISPYDPFAIPVSATANPFARIGPGEIKLIDFQIIGPIACIIEDPLPSIDFSRPAESFRSLAEPVRIGIWPFWAPNPGFGKLGPLFFEPFIFNSNPERIQPFASAGDCYGFSGTGAAAGRPPQESMTATIAGYYTDRNFFDRQWILKEREFIRKYNMNGRFEMPWNPDRATFPIEPGNIKKFKPSPITPYSFFSTNIITGNCAEDVMMPYLRCADHIMHYKPTEIKALRFYYFALSQAVYYSPTGTIPGTCPPPTPVLLPPEMTLLHMTVDCNHEIMSILKLICSRSIVNGPCRDDREYPNLGEVPDGLPRNDTLESECFDEVGAYTTYIGELENYFSATAQSIAQANNINEFLIL